MERLTLPIPVRLHVDESLSSWMIRAALRHGCSPFDFSQYYWEKLRVWTKDVDRGFQYIDPFVHQEIAKLSRCRLESVMGVSLYSLMSLLFECINPKEAIKWIIPISNRNRTHKTGQYYCPQCLEYGKSCYFPISWRFAWHLVCPTHGSILVNQCPYCHTPYQPHLLHARDKYINTCHVCKRSLGQELDTRQDWQFIRIQNDIDGVFQKGKSRLWGESVSAQQWFSLLRYLQMFLRNAIEHGTKPQRDFLDYMQIDLEDIAQIKSGLAFEYLTCDERRVLLSEAYKLIIKPKSLWFKALSQCACKKQTFINVRRALPQSLVQLIQSLPDNRTPKCMPAGGKPKLTERYIKRKWARIVRQYGNQGNTATNM